LDKALGGTGNGANPDTVQVNKYIKTWGGLPGGSCSSDGEMDGWSSYACYWSSESVSFDANKAYSLFFATSSVNPQEYNAKNNGFMLRCVKDN